MRIISQDGTIDIPYDYFSLSVVSGRYRDIHYADIYCYNLSSPSRTKLAEYSSDKKAEKAMEMLHEKYKKILGVEGGFDYTTNCYVQPNYWVLPKIFQFPKDDEVQEE